MTGKKAIVVNNTEEYDIGDASGNIIPFLILNGHDAAHDCDGDRYAGEKLYELTDHLGNVMSTVADRKVNVGKTDFEDYMNNVSGSWVSNATLVEADQGKIKVTAANGDYLRQLVRVDNTINYDLKATIDATNCTIVVTIWDHTLTTSLATQTFNMGASGGTGAITFNPTSDAVYVEFKRSQSGTGDLIFWVDDALIYETTETLAESYEPEVRTYTNLYPFGMQMPGSDMNYSSSVYRYGFNGMEKDDEAKGEGNSYDFGARIYDPRLGRWLSIDAYFAKTPGYSPYVFVGDSPILLIDPDGNYWRLPKDRDQRKLIRAEIKLIKSSSPTGRAYIRSITWSRHKVAVEISSGYSQFRTDNINNSSNPKVGSGGTIIFNPDQTLSGNELNGAVEGTPTRTFAEEMVHASRSVQGKSKYSNDRQPELPDGYSQGYMSVDEEIQTNHITNIIVSEMGRPDERRVKYPIVIIKEDPEDGRILDSKTFDIPLENSEGSHYEIYNYDNHVPKNDNQEEAKD